MPEYFNKKSYSSRVQLMEKTNKKPYWASVYVFELTEGKQKHCNFIYEKNNSFAFSFPLIPHFRYFGTILAPCLCQYRKRRRIILYISQYIYCKIIISKKEIISVELNGKKVNSASEFFVNSCETYENVC